MFQLQADFDQALKLTLELIKESLEYFEGNDVAETLVDPYMIAASIYLQTNKIPEAAAYLKKAEAVVKSLSGEINEKSLEIFTLQIQINMMQQNLPAVMDYLNKRMVLAQQLFGTESEQFCSFLEETVLFKKDLRQYAEAIPLAQKLVRSLREIHGGENNERVLAVYDALFAMYSETNQLNDALLLCQKRVSIYKALNGNDVKDMRMVTYLNEMALIN